MGWVGLDWIGMDWDGLDGSDIGNLYIHMNEFDKVIHNI